jgi:hypothetical protein
MDQQLKDGSIIEDIIKHRHFVLRNVIKNNKSNNNKWYITTKINN